MSSGLRRVLVGVAVLADEDAVLGRRVLAEHPPAVALRDGELQVPVIWPRGAREAVSLRELRLETSRPKTFALSRMGQWRTTRLRLDVSNSDGRG